MKRDLGKIIGMIVSAFAILLLGRLVLSYGLTVFEYLRTRVEFVQSTAANIGQQASSFLWTYRVLDVLAQAFLVFIAAACCIAMLREERRESSK